MPLFPLRACPTGGQSIFSKYAEGLGCVLHIQPSQIGTSVCQSALHTALAIVSTLLDRGLPMIGYLMPSASPLIVFLIGGCSALMHHLPSDFDGDNPDLAFEEVRD